MVVFTRDLGSPAHPHTATAVGPRQREAIRRVSRNSLPTDVHQTLGNVCLGPDKGWKPGNQIRLCPRLSSRESLQAESAQGWDSGWPV